MSHDRPRRLQRAPWRRFVLEELESRCLLSWTPPSSALPLDVSSTVPEGGLIHTAPTYYSFTVKSDGRLTAEVAPQAGATTRLSLLAADGTPLMQSDGQSASNPDDLIEIHLSGATAGTTYYLAVQGLSGSAGSYALMTSYTSSVPNNQTLPTGVLGWGMTSGYFRHDGHLDLAVTNFYSATVSIYLGNGDGTFTPGQTIPGSVGNLGIIAGDFTGTGKIDLAVASGLTGSVTILAGNGDGTFHPAGSFNAGIFPLGLTAGDFTGQHHQDLAVADYTAGAVNIFLNDGTGQFHKYRQYAVAGHPALGITAADLTGNGKIDLAVGNADTGTVSILLGNGDGTFTVTGSVAVGAYPQSIIAGDFTGHGKIDLAVANMVSNTVSILRGKGDGTFIPWQQMATGGQPWQVVAGDFNGDGRADLATVCVADGTISVFLGRSDGTFDAGRAFAAGSNPTALIAGDLHGGGTADLAVLDRTTDQVLVLLGKGDGTFFAPPRQTTQTRAAEVVSADFNGDGIADLAVTNLLTADVTILLGQGDGTFRFGGRYSVGAPILHLAVGDLRGNGKADLIATDSFGTDLHVLLGNGDGTFAPPMGYEAGPVPTTLALGDFYGDGKLDVAVTDVGSNQVGILRGDGTGRLSAPVFYTVGTGPAGIAAGDFDHDGSGIGLDLAVTNQVDNTVSILLNDGQGGFTVGAVLPCGTSPSGIVAGHFSSDGNLDLAVADAGGGVSIFLGDGRGNFSLATTLAGNPGMGQILVGDFEHNGKLDLVTYGQTAAGANLYLGNGDGTFAPGQSIAGAGGISGGVVGSFTGDGKLDFVTANDSASTVSLFAGNGDGTFQAPEQLPVTSGPVALAGADFNGDGNLDLVTANPTQGSIAVSLGNGDGTFQVPVTTSLGGEPIAVATGDFNRDGRTDLAVADYLNNTVEILLGNGDGTFQAARSYAVGLHPDAVVAGHFSGDGNLDLAVADFGDGTVTILRGRGDGTFVLGQTIAVGAGPVALAAGEVAGQAELVVANSCSHSLSILKQTGDGTFSLSATVPLGAVPSAVAVGDFRGDGRLDVAIAEQAQHTVAVFLSNADGTFPAPAYYPVGKGPVALAVADFNGDGHLDILVANTSSSHVKLLLGQGDGTFHRQLAFVAEGQPVALVPGDFNNSGRLGFATVNALGQTVSVALGLGDGTFVSAAHSGLAQRSTPLVGDLTGDGVPDVAILAGNGQILVRFGNPAAPGTFDPPIVLNPDSADRARDLALVRVNGRLVLAALDARDNFVSFYRYAGGRFVRTRGPATPQGLPVRLIAGDLTGNGRQDLIASSIGLSGGVVTVYLQQPDGSFGPASYQLSVGSIPADLALVNLSGGPGPDIVVTDQVSGAVRVLVNATTNPFATQLVFSSGTDVHTVIPFGGANLGIIAPEGPDGVVAGVFGGRPGLVVLNHAMDDFALLSEDGHGGLFNPQASLAYRSGTAPIALVSGDFARDGVTDLAVLDQASDQILLYRQDGQGGFTPLYTLGPDGQPQGIDAGNQPTGLAVADLAGDGKLDLLVGNAQGDVLVLQGNGDGTFRPYQRLDNHVALAVLPGSGGTTTQFVFADQALDSVTVSGALFQQGRSNGVLSPNAVKLADLDGDGIADLIVANGGGNDVLVYRGLGNSQFGPAQRFFVGTDPVAITVADLTGNGIPDLVVANKGSNDVSILYGQGHGDEWTLTQGPRLRAGTGPEATAVADVRGDGRPDILVANSGSDNVYLLPNIGQGFFDDQHPQVFATGADPVQLFVGRFDNGSGLDLVTVNAGSGDLTEFPGFGPGRSVSLGEEDLVTAVAGDFNNDGSSDLIVASAEGHFSLMQAGPNGLHLATVLNIPGLSNVSDIALGSVAPDAVTLFVTTAGKEEAFAATFLLSQGSDSSEALAASGPEGAAVRGAVLDSSPLLGAAAVELLEAGAGNHLVAEFSAEASSSLEVVATLTLASSSTGARPPAGAAEVEEVAESLSGVQGEPGSQGVDTPRSLGSPELDVQRLGLITGATQMPLLQHLRRGADKPAAEVTVPSFVELFDDSGAGVAGWQRQQAIDAVSRWRASEAGQHGAEPSDALPGPPMEGQPEQPAAEVGAAPVGDGAAGQSPLGAAVLSLIWSLGQESLVWHREENPLAGEIRKRYPEGEPTRGSN
jgi:hypothetical protein